MKKKIQPSFYVIILLLLTNGIKAQSSQRADTVNKESNSFFYAHALVAFIYDHTSIIKFHSGLGGEIGYGFYSKSHVTAYVGSIGYTFFPVRSNASPSNPGVPVQSESYIPIKVGIRERLINDWLYFNINGGIGIIGNSYNTIQTPDPSSLRPAADFGFGIKKGAFEAGINMDFFTEPKPDGGTGTVVLKAGFRF